MGQAFQWFLSALALVSGILLTVMPEKFASNGKPTKTGVRIARTVGIVILALFAIAAFAFFMALKDGQLAL